LWKKVLWNIKEKVKAVENVRICTLKVIEKEVVE
jgi:hypothetical protein